MVYIAFIVIQVFAAIMALLPLVKPEKVRRSDGTHVASFKKPNIKGELLGVVSIFKGYKFMLLLLAIFTAEMALAVQSSINGYYFDLRTRSPNNVAFNCIQVPAFFGMTYLLDDTSFRQRRTRALIGITMLSAITLVICSVQVVWLVQTELDRAKPGASVDWEDVAFPASFVIYTIYGCVYGIYQLVVQYVISSLSNDPSPLARYAGIFNGVSSLGLMASFVIDGKGASCLVQV